jgi:hypothetical protein
MKKVKVLNNQTIWDIALQEYGDVTGVFQILTDNPSIDLDTDLTEGTILYINGEPLNQDVVSYYKEKEIKPANKA